MPSAKCAKKGRSASWASILEAVLRQLCSGSSLLPRNPHHAFSAKLFLEAGKDDFCALRTLGEVYATLTGLPLRPRITGPEGIGIVKQIRERLTLITLSEQEYVAAIELASTEAVVDAAAYDALIGHCALKARADNEKDFPTAIDCPGRPTMQIERRDGCRVGSSGGPSRQAGPRIDKRPTRTTSSLSRWPEKHATGGRAEIGTLQAVSAHRCRRAVRLRLYQPQVWDDARRFENGSREQRPVGNMTPNRRVAGRNYTVMVLPLLNVLTTYTFYWTKPAE
jgi:hypothetical protein